MSPEGGEGGNGCFNRKRYTIKESKQILFHTILFESK